MPVCLGVGVDDSLSALQDTRLLHVLHLMRLQFASLPNIAIPPLQTASHRRVERMLPEKTLTL